MSEYRHRDESELMDFILLLMLRAVVGLNNMADVAKHEPCSKRYVDRSRSQ